MKKNGIQKMQKLRTAVPRDMMILGWNHEMRERA